VRHSPSRGSSIGRRHQLVHGERSEGALIGEDDGQLAVLRMLDEQPDPLVPLSGRVRAAQQQLPRHAEMPDDRRASVGAVGRQRHPEELPPASHRRDLGTLQPRDEVGGACDVPREGTLVVYGDRDDACAGHRRSEAGADDLDLGELRHGR